MKFKGYYEEVLGTPEKVRLLQLFLRFPTKGFTANEAARLVGLSAMGTWRIAKKFESYGIVSKRRVGKSDDWRLRPEHFLAKKLQFLAEEDALDELSKLFKGALKGIQVRRIILFGSTARHEERPDSDLDVFVVVPTEKDKERAEKALLDASIPVLDLFSNRLALVVFTERQVREKKEAGLALLGEIEQDGIVLYEGR